MDDHVAHGVEQSRTAHAVGIIINFSVDHRRDEIAVRIFEQRGVVGLEIAVRQNAVQRVFEQFPEIADREREEEGEEHESDGFLRAFEFVAEDQGSDAQSRDREQRARRGVQDGIPFVDQIVKAVHGGESGCREREQRCRDFEKKGKADAEDQLRAEHETHCAQRIEDKEHAVAEFPVSHAPVRVQYDVHDHARDQREQARSNDDHDRAVAFLCKKVFDNSPIVQNFPLLTDDRLIIRLFRFAVKRIFSEKGEML